MAREPHDAPGRLSYILVRFFIYTHSSFYSEADRTRLTRFIASLSDLKASIFVHYLLYKLFILLTFSVLP